LVDKPRKVGKKACTVEGKYGKIRSLEKVRSKYRRADSLINLHETCRAKGTRESVEVDAYYSWETWQIWENIQNI
jgi:hypothetical protein